MPGGFNPLSDGLYWKRGKGGKRVYYERIRRDGKDQFKQVPAANPDEARAIRVRRSIQYKQYLEGIPGVEDPYGEPKVKPSKVTMGELFDAYIGAGCPTKKRKILSDDKLKWEKARLAKLRSWPGWKQVAPQTSGNRHWTNTKLGDVREQSASATGVFLTWKFSH